MNTVVPNNASTGFAGSLLYQDPPVDASGYLALANSYLTALGLASLPDTSPTANDLREAKVLLLDQLLGSFPFGDSSARACALALTLQPLARPLILGPTPLYVVSGVRGIGKTTLLKTAVLPYRRAEVVNTFGVHGEREWQKIISVGLSRNPSHFFIEGQAFRLSSPALAQVLTANNFMGRLLYSWETTTFPIRCTWAFASEEPKMSQDIADRAVHIPLTGQAKYLGFSENEEDHFAGEQFFAAALTLIRGWLEAGAPRFTDRRHRMSHWSEVMGGILAVADVPGFLDK